MTTSVPVSDTSGKKVVRVSCIHYLVWFQKSQKQVKALLYNNREVNAINLVFAQKLGFHIQKTNVKAQKINSSALKTFEMVIANLEGEDKAGRSKFFQETFLVANTKFKAILGMLFLKMSKANLSLVEKTFMWKSYTTSKALSTIE